MLLKYKFKPWQPEAVKKMVEMKRFAVFDTVGVGKTVESIGAIQLIANNFDIKAVVIAESSLVLQWKNECEKFSYLKTFCVTSGSKERRHRIYYEFFNFKGSAILVINYGKLRYDFDVFRSNKIDVLIYDEALILANFNDTRKFACWLNQKTEFVYALTATPFSRDIMQWYDLFECIGVQPMSRDTFMNTFAEFTIDRIRTKKGYIKKASFTGAKNLSLMKQYYTNYYIRRTKKDVKKDTEIIPHNIYYRLFELSKEQKAMYAKIKDGFIQIYRGAIENKELEPLSAYTSTLQVLDSAYLLDQRLPKQSPKIEGLLSVLEEIGDEKVFIYSRFRMFGQMVVDAIQKLGKAHFIHGELDSATIEEYKQDFKYSASTKYLVATDIAQRGLNLQEASTIIFMDLPATPDAIFQLIGRLDREGQTAPFINVFFMLSDNTVEFNVFNLLKDRQKIFDDVLDESGSKMFNISKDEFIKML